MQQNKLFVVILRPVQGEPGPTNQEIAKTSMHSCQRDGPEATARTPT
jgi:hypothetical protein